MNTWGINFQDCVIKNADSWLRWLHWLSRSPEEWFYHDYADALTTMTKLTTLIFNSKWKIISSLTTLTTLLWKATINNTLITDYVDIQKWKIVIIDYVDYPVLHITVTYAGIFSRNFIVVLHASLAKACKTPLKFLTVKLLWHIQIYENTEIPGENSCSVRATCMLISY